MSRNLEELQAPYPNWPRYVPDRKFPEYRYVPGLNAHPREDSDGHSYGESEPDWVCCEPHEWKEYESYLYGVDLYNYAYWWECHEMFESMWHAAGHHTVQGYFLQAIILSAASNLNWHRGLESGSKRLGDHSLANFEYVLDSGECENKTYMGVVVPKFMSGIERYMNERVNPPVIKLKTK